MPRQRDALVSAKRRLGGLRGQLTPAQPHQAVHRDGFAQRLRWSRQQQVEQPVTGDVAAVAGQRLVGALPVDDDLDALLPDRLHQVPVRVRGRAGHRFLHAPHELRQARRQTLGIGLQFHRMHVRAGGHQCAHRRALVERVAGMNGGVGRDLVDAQAPGIDLVIDDRADRGRIEAAALQQRHRHVAAPAQAHGIGQQGGEALAALGGGRRVRPPRAGSSSGAA